MKRLGWLQTRWTYLNRDYSLLTPSGNHFTGRAHFVVEHGARSRRGTFFFSIFQRNGGRLGAVRPSKMPVAGSMTPFTEDTDPFLSRTVVRMENFYIYPDIEWRFPNYRWT